MLSADRIPLATAIEISAASFGIVLHNADLSALAAGVHGLAWGVGERFGYGGVSQTVIQMDQALFFITPAGRGTCVALTAGPPAPKDGRQRRAYVLHKAIPDPVRQRPVALGANSRLRTRPLGGSARGT